MEKSKDLTSGRLGVLDNAARQLIYQVLVPEFDKLKTSYPDAVSWDVSIAVYKDKRDMYELITMAAIDPEDGGDNPSDSVFVNNDFGEAILKVLSTVSFILNAKPEKYGITVDNEPYKGDLLQDLRCYGIKNS